MVRWFLSLMMLLFTVLSAGCCESPRCQARQPWFLGGGEDVITVDLPFAEGYQSLCTQGALGQTSHRARSTKYDVDLDTPNTRDDAVYAPASGVAYTHFSSTGFGNHVNIDLGDGTYLILGHLKSIAVAHDTEVARGQLLGVEGTTGASTGDHVHFGRHQGNAALNGIYGTSIEGLEMQVHDTAANADMTVGTTEMICGLSGGRVYTSRLPVAQWHPEGSLLKLPQEAIVYLVEEHALHPFVDEASFLSRGYSFGDVAIIGEEEFSCYSPSEAIQGSQTLTAVHGSGTWDGVWLLVDAEAGVPSHRLKVPSGAWWQVLATYNLGGFSTVDDLMQDPSGELIRQYPYQGEATFRDGSIMKVAGQSALYVMRHGAAMPVATWEAYLLLGFWPNHQIHEVGAFEFEQGIISMGDCATDTFCLTRDDVLSCVGPVDLIAAGQGGNLNLTWQMPGGQMAETLTLSGEVTHDGMPQGWYTYATAANASAVTAMIPAQSGDSFRFSVEYRVGNVVSWSCLGPYPPGTTPGSVVAEFASEFLGYSVAADPTSSGCGLQIQIP